MNQMRLHHFILYILMLSAIAPVRGQSSAGSNIVSRTLLSGNGLKVAELRVYDNGLGDVVQEVQSWPGSSLPSLVVRHDYDDYRRRTRSWLDMYYYNKDHLGNNREVVSASGSVQQLTNYYPFGAPYADPNAVMGSTLQPFKYNGKELDTMHGLNTYDYGARQYYSIVGRWDRIDPLCEKYYSVSPYVYCEDDPVNAIDPDGRVGLKVIAKGLYKVGKTVAKKGLSSLSKGTTYATAFNDVVEDVKTVFDSKASTGDRFVAGFSLLSEVISPVSYKDAKTIGNAANGISRRILPNGGNAKPHGGKKHNDAIDEYIKKLKESGGNSNIRKNQKQVDASGNTVGNNRPDIQYDDENSVYHNIEFDSSAKHSARHKRTIESNDGQSDNIFIILNRNHDK